MVTILYTLASFVSAFLLFLIQPMFAKMILPMLGGAPAVWNTAMVFYQALLLGGYSYAHLATIRLKPRTQHLIHLGLLFLPFFVLPFGVDRAATPPITANPVPWLLVAMAGAIGLPFFIVSSTAPLLQRWFSQTGHRHSGDPYFLYAASNLGSMLALLGYPIFIEPKLTLADQARLWTAGYGVMAVLLIFCAGIAYKSAPDHAEAIDDGAGEIIPWPRIARWIGLAFVPSAMMLAVTSFLTSDVASAPMLWIGPLTLYLLSFIFVFAKRHLVPIKVWIAIFPVLVAISLFAVSVPMRKPMWLQVALAVATFFVGCMACHGQLAADRPSPKNLTKFYLTMSFGGVLGGMFCALFAPVAFKDVYELPAILIISGLFVAVSNREWVKRSSWAVPIAVGGATAIGYHFAQLRNFNGYDIETMGYLAPGILIALFAMRRPLPFALSLATAFGVMAFMDPDTKKLEYGNRSFFGVLKVEADYEYVGRRALTHGTTLHGFQDEVTRDAPFPTSYYYRTGPVGRAFETLPSGPRRVAVIGLGTGTMAAYSRPGDAFTIFEIDPLVYEIAKNPKYFTYLSRAKGAIKVELGDARLTLRHETETYDAMVFDAYSSDSVPVHLLTREAVELYLKHLKPGGLLLFHISNRHLDLGPVLAQIKVALNLKGVIMQDNMVTDDESQDGKLSSEWVAMAEETDALDPLLAQNGEMGSLINPTESRWEPLEIDPKIHIWTDDYSSLLEVWQDNPLRPWLRGESISSTSD